VIADFWPLLAVDVEGEGVSEALFGPAGDGVGGGIGVDEDEWAEINGVRAVGAKTTG
jgi:hypothetical protein